MKRGKLLGRIEEQPGQEDIKQIILFDPISLLDFPKAETRESYIA